MATRAFIGRIMSTSAPGDANIPALVGSLQSTRCQGPLGISFVFWHVSLALLLGILMAVTELDVLPFVIFGWLLVVALVVWHYRRKGPPTAARKAFAIYVGVTAAVLIAAFVAPVKTIDQLYHAPVRLPSTSMTLGELKDFIYLNHTKNVFPLPVRMEVADEESLRRVTWNSNDMTYQEFVDAIESQTALRHYIRSCGNATTILWGVDPGSGSFFVPTQPDP